jgi:AcrR family transcriptional regulator
MTTTEAFAAENQTEPEAAADPAAAPRPAAMPQPRTVPPVPGMPGCPRRGPGRPRSEEAERAILDAALDQLARCGIAGLSIEAVAQHAGVAKTTVYRRWSNKTELVVAALAELKGPLVRPPGGDVRSDLLFLLEYAAESLRKAPATETEIFARLMAEAREHPDLMRQYWERVIGPRREILRGVLSRGVDEGLIRPDADLLLMVEMLMSPIVMCGLNWCIGGLSPVQVEQILDAVLAGWAPTQR